MYHERFIQRITTLFDTGMACGELRSINSSLATWTLLGMMYPYFHPSPPSGMLPSAGEIEQLLSIFFDGIATHGAN
jgi:hypothetical protein